MPKETDRNFKYNGIPIYKVGFSDFSYIVNCFESGSRIFSRNIKSEDVKKFYTRTDKNRNAFGVFYEGVIIDFRNLKKPINE